ncbi:MAG TPA: symporter [Microscillaceae bacterium]|jgi:BASS family bile acid:Na+ symporter|nr:symporter [Microscillaceae bacterium]
MPIDEVVLRFDPERLKLLNFCLAFIMLGIALDLRVSDFKALLKQPLATLVGVASQMVVLPALTFLLVYWLNPYHSIGLGMLLVAACPGGNVSNLLTHIAGGNVALSVSLTAINTLLAAFTTPFNFWFWSSLWAQKGVTLPNASLGFLTMFESIFTLIIMPTIFGMTIASLFPGFTQKIRRPFQWFSITFLGLFIVVTGAANFQVFLQYFIYIFFLVLLHNAVALSAGWSMGTLFRLPAQDIRTISIETGIQNSGLGLILIFNGFGGLGGMALVAAWWGVWHIISGLVLARWWQKTPLHPST